MVADARGDRQRWDLPSLWDHLQGVVDLELWTIPYYLTAMYSVEDPSGEAYQLIQSVVYQEMLHVQLSGNVANAFGHVPTFTAPSYVGRKVPHLCFHLDVPNPTDEYSPYSAELGPLDPERINTLCLIEYPEWDTERTPDLRPRREEYGSIGEFYAAVRAGMAELRDHVRGGVNQVDQFGPYYQGFPQQTITRDGYEGYRQATTLVDVITDQGEGQTQGDADVPPDYRNTADGLEESWTHFWKFTAIRNAGALPATYEGVAEPPAGSPGHRAQRRLIEDFAVFLETLSALFGGASPEGFGSQMARLGGDVLTCWQNGAIPRFS